MFRNLEKQTFSELLLVIITYLTTHKLFPQIDILKTRLLILA